MKKKVLITGAAGFLGSHTVDKFLENNFEVRGIDNFSTGNKDNISHLKNNKNFKFEEADLKKKLNSKFIKDCKYIIHFAGIGDIVPSIEQPKIYYDNNFSATLNLLNSLDIRRIKKFVFAASSSCYGIAKTPTSESHIVDPQYPYAQSKYFAEQLCLHWHKVYKLPVNSLRIFNAYGPRSRTTGAYGAVIGVFMRQLIAKKPFTVVGNGKQKRDFLFVSDLAEAFFKAAVTKKSGKIWNLGSSSPQSINKLCRILGSNKKVKMPIRPGEPNITHANITKISKDLNWKPKIRFEEGIKMVKQNKKYWLNSPLWNKKNIKMATKSWFKYLK